MPAPQPPLTARDSAGTQTRQKLIRTEVALFGRDGYENTSIQDNIDAAGIDMGTFCHHFRGQDELLAAMLRRIARPGKEGNP
jgi:AcrR family transcriptional regulator